VILPGTAVKPGYDDVGSVGIGESGWSGAAEEGIYEGVLFARSKTGSICPFTLALEENQESRPISVVGH
jgi:hypothetical protein